MATHYIVFFFVLLGCKIGSHASPVTELTDLLLGVESSVSTISEAHFRNDYVYISEYDSYYKFHYLAKDFEDAALICMEEKAVLLAPESKEEIWKAINVTSNKDLASLWIGIHNMFNDDIFYTLEGTSLKEDFNLDVDVEEFRTRNYYGEIRIKLVKHCLNAYSKYINNNDAYSSEIFSVKYQTQECSDKYQYICKKKAKTIVYNKECGNYDTSYVRADTGSCYKLHTLHRNWTEAFKICVAEQASLVEINNEEEANFLVSQLSKLSKNDIIHEFVHIGFSNLIIKNVFTTNSGQFLSDAGYEQWTRNHQTIIYDLESKAERLCGALYLKGGLMTTNCQAKTKFFCEKKASDKPQ